MPIENETKYCDNYSLLKVMNYLLECFNVCSTFIDYQQVNVFNNRIALKRELATIDENNHVKMTKEFIDCIRFLNYVNVLNENREIPTKFKTPFYSVNRNMFIIIYCLVLDFNKASEEEVKKIMTANFDCDITKIISKDKKQDSPVCLIESDTIKLLLSNLNEMMFKNNHYKKNKYYKQAQIDNIQPYSLFY